MKIEEIEVKCSKIPELIDVETIAGINSKITEPDLKEEQDSWEFAETLANDGVEGEGLETNREEDYYQFRDPGRIETLIEQILPLECEQNNNVLWLTSVIISEIAQNQAFGEGNKRTAYMTGIIFLIQVQVLKTGEATYPRLTTEFTDKLSELAIDQTEQEETLSREEFYSYLKEKMS